MSKRDIRALCWRAFLAGNLEGGDPFEGGKAPTDIVRAIRRSFAAWWKENRP